MLRNPALPLFCAFPLCYEFVFRGNEPKKDAIQPDFLNFCTDPNTSTTSLSLGHLPHLAPSLTSLAPNETQCAIAPHCPCPPVGPDPTCSVFEALFSGLLPSSLGSLLSGPSRSSLKLLKLKNIIVQFCHYYSPITIRSLSLTPLLLVSLILLLLLLLLLHVFINV